MIPVVFTIQSGVKVIPIAPLIALSSRLSELSVDAPVGVTGDARKNVFIHQYNLKWAGQTLMYIFHGV